MLYAAPAITIYSCFIAALLGACMGSFLNCAAWRIVHGESVLRGRSHCDVCGHVLAPRDLVPVFSYVFSHGRCRYCGAKLSPRHAVGEAVAALVFVSLLLRYDISLRTLEAWAVACLLLACAFADLEGYIIPDRFIAVGVVLFIVTLFFVPDPGKRALDGLIGGVAVGGGVLLLALLMEKLLRRDAMAAAISSCCFSQGCFWAGRKTCCACCWPASSASYGALSAPSADSRAFPGAPASRWPPGAPPCSARTLSTGTCHCCNTYHRSTRANTPANVSFRCFLPFSPWRASVRLRLKSQKNIRKYIAGRCGAVLPLSIDGIGKRGSPYEKNRWH